MLSLMKQLLLLLLFLVLQLTVGGETISCPSTSATGATKPLYLLTLIGGDDELSVLSGARIAQDQINNYTDLFPGYHVELVFERIGECSSFTVLSKLAKHILNPTCRPIVAIIGLMCSSHTSLLSPVAGHDGYDLIQLSSANSPILQTQNHRFPHLWRFLGSATAYADTVLSMMEQFKWKRVGVVYNTESNYHRETAQYIEHIVKQSDNRSVAFSVGVSGTRKEYFDYAFSAIHITRVAVLIVLLSDKQASIFNLRALEEEVVYPKYITTYAEHMGVPNSRYSILLTQNNDSQKLVLDVKFRQFQDNCLHDLTPKLECLQSSRHASTLASYLYDQVWAIALAVNNSLPVLENRNLSIDNYTIGQHEISDVIEEQLANLSFQGAGGWIEFNQYRSVSTPVEVFWVSANGTNRRVGIYNPVNPINFHVDINSSDLPSDTIQRLVVVILIPPPVTILLYTVTGFAIVFITIQLILYLHYRHHKVIKATSPYLSLLMFAGCYLLCVAATLINTFGSFDVSAKVFTVLSILNVLCISNAISLILITLFIKLVRVYHIFSSWMQKDLGSHWNNCPLLSIILLLTVIPNAIFVTLTVVRPPKHSVVEIFRSNLIVEKHNLVEAASNFTIIILVATHTVIFLALLLYIGLTSRKIKLKNFNDSHQVIFLLGVFFLNLCLTISLLIIFLLRRKENIYRSVVIAGLMVFSLSCQLILFSPKLVHAVLENCQSCIKNK